jgi:hypothetical protein
MDDIIVLSPTLDRHLEDLEEVFTRLRLFKLGANRRKCVFACAEVKFLGHIIKKGGISADPDKVSAILHMDAPRNVRQLLSFLQTCSWFRRFVPGFSDVAKPLTELTKKTAVWTWGTAQEDAFAKLKDLLSAAPILRQADSSLSYTLRTDASSYALGACLLQGEGPDERPVEYASRLLTPAEKNYTTTEREALAIVFGVQKFRGYLEGARVIVASDHQPLKWLMSLRPFVSSVGESHSEPVAPLRRRGRPRKAQPDDRPEDETTPNQPRSPPRHIRGVRRGRRGAARPREVQT